MSKIEYPTFAFLGPYRTLRAGEQVDPDHVREVDGESLVPVRVYGATDDDQSLRKTSVTPIPIEPFPPQGEINIVDIEEVSERPKHVPFTHPSNIKPKAIGGRRGVGRYSIGKRLQNR